MAAQAGRPLYMAVVEGREPVPDRVPTFHRIALQQGRKEARLPPQREKPWLSRK